jgi:hypothetical protein
MLSWIAPAIGHVGIVNSHGTVFDFQGDHYIGRNNMLFGEPKEKWRVPIDAATLDHAIDVVEDEFHQVNYSFLCSNCHFFVASCLEQAGVHPPCCCSDWRTGATAKIAFRLVLSGRSISVCDFVTVWLPFVILVGIIVLIALLMGNR